MKRPYFILAGLLFAIGMPLLAQVDYDEFFLDKAMRVDLYLTGDAREELVTIDHIYQEGIWPETPTRLVEPFENGRFAVKVYDVASNRLIYSRGFDSMFGEYKTTTPALNGLKRVFNRSVRVPYPRRPVLFVIEARDRKNILHPLFTETVDPSDYHIITETTSGGAIIYEALKNGPPRKSVDLVFVAEGYTAEDKDKFRSDVDRFTGRLFEIEPYRSAKAVFNVTGIMRPSPERAMDEPRQGAYKKTGLNASFNAFDLDRYMLIEDGHRLREVAAEVPYDAIVGMVNSKRYGGGGIYNDYCVTTVDNERSKAVFVHEFGHSFAGLADEYYASDVSYNDFYPKGVEPLEPNITALLDPRRVKWADLLSPGIQVPTEYGKERIEALQAEARKILQEAARDVESAKAKGLSEKEIKKIQERSAQAVKDIQAKIEAVRKEYASVADKVGVFEGAGYASKGLFRPMVDCLMISSPKQEFCLVCRRAITRMVDYYTGN
ncbi:hypothetical protein D4R89_08850 [bacterium]|nr:MAG: hypothetical protein D4R89_08850 [bacterium]